MIYRQTTSRGSVYYLNIGLIDGKPEYYFTSDEHLDTGCELPRGYEVSEDSLTGLLSVEKKL